MAVRRLVAEGGINRVPARGVRSIPVLGKDRRPVPAKRLEVTTVLRVVCVLFQPVKGIPRDFERQPVAGHLPYLTGGEDQKRHTVGNLVVTQPGIEASVWSEDPV